VSARGLLEDFILYEGKILDGRERYVSCLRKQVPPRFQEYAGECGSALEFVVSKNLHCRHLTDGQRALVAARPPASFSRGGPTTATRYAEKRQPVARDSKFGGTEKQPKNAEAAEAGCRPPGPPSLEERGK
jgi:hypothetical protein